MAYDITGNALLTVTLGPTELAAHQQVASDLLGFTAVTEFTDEKKARAENAMSLQVVYQVEAGINAFLLASERRGARWQTYRGGNRKMPPIHPLAKKLATALLNSTVSEAVR